MSCAQAISHTALRTLNGTEAKFTGQRRARATCPAMRQSSVRSTVKVSASKEDNTEGSVEFVSTRRQLMLGTGATISLAPLFADVAEAEELTTFSEKLLAYKFDYPKTDANGAGLKWFTTRTPERYSSAAPMSADARQRIVYEQIDFSEPLIITVSVGPIPPYIADIPQDEWTATQIAEAILMEKSTGRVTNGQRTSLSSIEEASTVEKDGVKYWLYEHISQGSPNPQEILSKETYRHSLAVTGLRGNYMYTLNLAAPERRWDSMADLYEAAQKSFTLVTPTKDFVPPEKDPWRFW